uniref:Putative ixostatin n=1 Tax=Ixodes ricinus TaxID=34613 RepID=A0A0K8R5Z4_IXORI
MQLPLFVVIVAFVHLSCEEESEPSPDMYGPLKYLPKDCKNNLIKQIQDKCEGHKFQPELQWVTECQFKCGSENDNGYLMIKAGQIYHLKDGTPCGHSRVCITGKCVDTCEMNFVPIKA